MSSSKCKDKTTLTNKQRQDIVIYKSKHPSITNIELFSNPHCFEEVNHNRLGVKYDASKKAWMTMILFQKWLEEFDLKITGYKIILLLDGAKVHSTTNLNLCNITLLDQYEVEKDEKNECSWYYKVYCSGMEGSNARNKIYNYFQYTGILSDAQDNEESFINNNNDKLMDELYTDIEVLNFPNMIDLEEYIDYLGEKKTNEDLTTNLESENESVKDDNSTEMHQVSYQEALNVVEILEHYIVQNDFSEQPYLNMMKL
ncbi:36477_t:CDS:2 [Gigaspora margarita]|uniref:36477_t:CDS:1 n=1 Tax=Gigaspora margarita TaxID=4874 RepID=A0ABM8W6L8_GIGMA|nr:36477_t:CDS:2 [Gigaspora margarita]